MALLKEMFNTKQTSETVSQKDTTISIDGQSTTIPKRTYQEWGVYQAGQVDATPTALHSCLQATYVQERKRVQENEQVQNRRKNEVQKKINDLEAEKETIEIKIRNENEKLQHEGSKIDVLKKEIDVLKEHPQDILKSLGEDRSVKAGFFIGGFIILLLTVYLFIFYSSAAYSAFFKNFTPDDTNIVNSIFDSNAFSKALADGTTELILILTIPAVFLGLGFLIHKFNEQEGFGKYLKITGLVLTTFIFDFILAYEIVEKIYNIKQQGSFEAMPDMTIKMAAQQINFWLIIFAGFVVYVIWGFVFDLVMKEYQKLDAVRYAIKNRNEKIKEYKIECKTIKEKIQKLETQKAPILAKINTFKNELTGVIILIDDTKEAINDFFTGWLSYMSSAGKPKTDVDNCTAIRNDFLNQLQNNAFTLNISN